MTTVVGISDVSTQEASAWPHYTALKTKWLRAEFHWYIIEGAQGQFNWAPYDLIVSRANAAGIKLLAIINHPPLWARTATFNQHVSAIAAKFAARYPGIAAWEVFNEPNHSQYYGWPWQDADPVVSAQRYAGAVNAFSTGYTGAGMVVAGAMSLSGHHPDIWIPPFLAATSPDDFGAFSIHPYGYPSYMSNMSINIKTLMINGGHGAKKVWFSEMGDPNPVTIQATMNATFAQVPQIDALFWFSLRDLQPIGYNYGVVEYNWVKKIARYNQLKAFLTTYSKS